MTMTMHFKIGEYAIGGIIKIQQQGALMEAQCFDLDTKLPIEGVGCKTTSRDEMDNFLNEVTSSYYADKIMQSFKF